jgi:hypothetical protein
MVTTRHQSREVSVFINKLEAARRQLDTAIRLTFANEDALAIHTLAAAAYRILRDILHERGQHGPDEALRGGMYAMALRFARGELSDKEIQSIKESASLYQTMCTVAKHINAQEAEGVAFTFDQVSVTSSKQTKLSHWQSMGKVANFLKHANTDANAILDLNDVDNDTLLFHASGAYTFASHHFTPEMAIFIMYFFQKTGSLAGIRTDEAAFVDMLERLSPARRRQACTKVIRISKRYGGALPFWND